MTENEIHRPPSRDHSIEYLVHVFFLVSGASALTYEILWTRQFVLLAGATTPAVSLVLALFMGGLALGAWGFGRLADRQPNLLRWYAGMEVAIGLFALVQPWLLNTLGKVYLRYLPEISGQGINLLGLRILMASALLLIPTTLMGGTFPILVRWMLDRNGRLGRSFGMLYGANLLGAVLGSAFTGFVLIRVLGIQGTLHWAVALNIGVGLIAFFLSKVQHPKESNETPLPAEEQEISGIVSNPMLQGILWLMVFFSGFLTMGYQVAWSRMLVFSLNSTIYTFTLILVVFLLGLALGSFIFTRLFSRFNGLQGLMFCQSLAAWTSLGLASMGSLFPYWEEAISRIFAYSGQAHLAITLFICALVMLLPVTCMGVIFPLSSRMLLRGVNSTGRRIGTTYWINTLGSIVGSLATGFLLIPLLSVKGCLLVLAGLQASLAFMLLPWGGFSFRVASLLGLGGVGLSAALSGFFLHRLRGPNPFDGWDTRPDIRLQVEAHRDDPSASVTVVRTPNGDRLIRINGFTATSDTKQAGYMPMMSHLPILLHGRAQSVLVICVGTGATAGAVLLHPGIQVDAVDINSTVLEFAPLFKHVNHGLHQDPRAQLIHDDGRNFLLSTRKYYDVITLEPMPPTHAGVVNLYSQEYYALAKNRLNPGGMLVQWLPIHLVSPRESASILRSVQNVFPETTLWLHSDMGLIVAKKDQSIRVEIPQLSASFQEKRLAEELSKLGVPSVDAFIQLYALGPLGIQRFVGDAPPVTDDDPSLEFHRPRSNHVNLLAGKYIPDCWHHLQLILALQEQERLPIDGLSQKDLRSIQMTFQLRTVLRKANLWMEVGQLSEAEKGYSHGLSLATRAEDRGECLFRLALISHAKGDFTKTKSLLEQCLQENPHLEAAINLRKTLESS